MGAEETQGRLRLPPRFDPFAPTHNRPVHLLYAEFRAAGRLLRAGPGAWAVPRYADVARLLRDPRVGPFRFGDTPSPDYAQAQLSADDQARGLLDASIVAAHRSDHARLRKVLAPLLASRLTRDLEMRIEALVNESLARCSEWEGMDAVPDLAFFVTVRALGHLFGLPHAQQERIGRDLLALSKIFVPSQSVAERGGANHAATALRTDLDALLDARLRAQTGDLVSDIACAVKAGVLGRQEAVDNTVFLMFAGLETSMNMIAAACASLAAHPREFARLRKSPGLAASAVEEILRYDAPTQITARRIIEPIEIAERTLGRGRVLLLMLGSANHDEAQFHEAARLDITREPNPHLAFGAGGRVCLGAGLARLLGRVTLRQIARTFSTFEPAGPAIRDSCATPRIYLTVPIRVTVQAPPARTADS